MQLFSAEIHYRLIKKLPDCSEPRLVQAILALHRSIPILISEDVSEILTRFIPLFSSCIVTWKSCFSIYYLNVDPDVIISLRLCKKKCRWSRGHHIHIPSTTCITRPAVGLIRNESRSIIMQLILSYSCRETQFLGCRGVRNRFILSYFVSSHQIVSKVGKKLSRKLRRFVKYQSSDINGHPTCDVEYRSVLDVLPDTIR